MDFQLVVLRIHQNHYTVDPVNLNHTNYQQFLVDYFHPLHLQHPKKKIYTIFQ